MQAKFEVRYDPAARLLTWRMADFWDPADVTAFAAAMRDAVAPLGPPPITLRDLCDSRDFPVQSPEVAAALSAVNMFARQIRHGPTAIVVGSHLNKLQAERTLVDPDLKVSLSLDEARAWLEAQPLA